MNGTDNFHPSSVHEMVERILQALKNSYLNIISKG